MKRFAALLFLLTGLSVVSNAQDAPAKFLSGDDFVLTAEDKAAGIGGTVKVAINVDKSGDVDRAAVYIGPAVPCSGKFNARVRELTQQIETGVKKYKFSPALEDGLPTEQMLSLSINLDGPAESTADANATVDVGSLVKPRINGGVLNGKAVYLPKPAYPSEARSQRAEGTVSVEVLIDENGKVVTSQAVAGPVLLQEASREAACGARFSPTTLQGQPVKVRGTVVYNFIP